MMFCIMSPICNKLHSGDGFMMLQSKCYFKITFSAPFINIPRILSLARMVGSEKRLAVVDIFEGIFAETVF